jgi:hypothetical protein
LIADPSPTLLDFGPHTTSHIAPCHEDGYRALSSLREDS